MRKKFKRVVVHVGWDKTGSSTIQYFLDTHRDSIAKDFLISYPLGRWHAILGSVMSSRPEKYITNIYNGLSDIDAIRRRDSKFVKDFEASILEYSPNDTLCVSYEGFVSLDESALEKLKAYFLYYSNVVEIIAYVRPVFSYAKSAMSQRAKQGQPVLVNDCLPKNDYKSILEKFFRVFGRESVHVRSFSSKGLVGGDVLIDFMDFCGVKPSDFEENYQVPPRENESLRWPAIVFSDALREQLEKRKVEYTVSDYGRLLGGRLSSVEGPRIPVEEKLQAQLLLESSEDAEFLEKEYGIDIIDKNDSERDYVDVAWEPVVVSLADALSYSFETALKGCKSNFRRAYEGYVAASPQTSALRCGQHFELEVFVANTSSTDWLVKDSSGPKMSYHWKKDGETYVFDGIRTPIPHSKILSGKEEKVLARILAPNDPGEYTLVMTAVEESRCWLENEGLSPAYLKFFVS